MASRVNTAKAKEKKQKIIAAVGGVLLLALLAYQVPKLMKHGQHAPVPQSGNPSATASTTTPGSTAAPTATGTAQLTASNTKLASFTLFSSKDPFVPRVSDKIPSSTPATSTPAATTPPAASTSTPKGSGPMFGTVDGPATATPSPTGGTTAAPSSQLPGATLKLNGTKIRVQLGQAFPKNQPIFRLAGIKKGSVRIALVKGGLADGTSAVTLAKRHPLTLVNTADNKRWTIVLLSANKGT